MHLSHHKNRGMSAAAFCDVEHVFWGGGDVGNWVNGGRLGWGLRLKVRVDLCRRNNRHAWRHSGHPVKGEQNKNFHYRRSDYDDEREVLMPSAVERHS